jgi:hypothetical protein
MLSLTQGYLKNSLLPQAGTLAAAEDRPVKYKAGKKLIKANGFTLPWIDLAMLYKLKWYHLFA